MSEADRTHFMFENSGERARVKIKYRTGDTWTEDFFYFNDDGVCILDRTGRRLVDVTCMVGEKPHLGFSFLEGVTPYPDWQWTWGQDWLLIGGPGEMTVAQWSSFEDEEDA